ncbi:NAD+ kinase, partial [Tremellales sp. Uapishka_1]
MATHPTSWSYTQTQATPLSQSSRFNRPPHLRRHSSYLKKLDLDAKVERETFGLTDFQVSTSPYEDDLLIHLDTPTDTMSFPPSPSTPNGHASGKTPTPVPAPPLGIPTTNRMRNPVPPSPLSRVQAPTGAAAIPSPSSHHLQARSASQPAAQQSPCFIHSHLDRHGSLQDWLRNKGNNPTAKAHPHPHSHPHNHAHVVSAHPQQAHIPSHHKPSTSAKQGLRSPATSTSGYESDRSSVGGNGSRAASGEVDGESEEEDTGSLTRQLAETAQGVREMSKELGRTRVKSKIHHVLIVTKARDNRLIQLTRELAIYLMEKKPASSSERPDIDGRNEQRGMVVYVDAQLRTSKRFDAAGIQRDYPHLFQPLIRRRSSSSASVNTLSAFSSTVSMNDISRKPKDEGQLRFWTSEMCSNSPNLFDFVVTLGGDGTVLFTSWLFQKIVPPVLPFALGSLGFLTNFDFANYKQHMDKVIDDGIRVNLRMRFTCTVYRAVTPDDAKIASGKCAKKRKAIKRAGGEILMSQVDNRGWEELEGQSANPNIPPEGTKDKEIMCFSTRPVEQFEVLNDLVVDRGPSPYVSLLEVFGDEHHLTTVQADGLTVSTPTGSTAYSLSAGGSLVHPGIPALLITPICPHTLSFRPMLLPDSMELRICVPYNSRSTAWASFDGRGRVELKQGDHIKVTASKYPFPTVCAEKQSTDWFNSISRTLRWNEREKQKSFVVIEEDHEPASKSKQRKSIAKETGDTKTSGSPLESEQDGAGTKKEDDADEDEDEEDDEEEEEDFDIDDKSGGDQTPSSPSPPTDNKVPVNKLHSMLDSHKSKSGVDSPDRFILGYEAPPKLSQRHLVEALNAAEIKERENEEGQRDYINSDPSALRVSGNQMPQGRSLAPAHSPSVEDPNKELKTPRPHHTHASGSKARSETNFKAFAFFGQDDSASDMSDEPSE